uniref:Uncharacterized protein n=1 Tax=Sparus aurata TaxID=8175 RepID=A0A671WZH9_SPAAU
MIISSAKQQSSKVVSVQKTSSVSSVRQQTHTTSQKTVSVSSTQSAQAITANEVQASFSAVAKTEDLSPDRKRDSKNQTTKASVKSEDKNEAQSENKRTKDHKESELNVTSEKDVKESRSPQRGNKKKTDHCPPKSQEKVSDQTMQMEKAAANTNGKTGKQNQKAKKNNKQEKQVETKRSSESESVEVKEAAEVKVICESKEVKTELKQGIESVTAPPAHATATVSTTDRQPEPPAPTKKKKRSKKSKGGAQAVQGKESSPESKREVIETKTVTPERSPQTQETTAQIHKSVKEEQVEREVITTESKDEHVSRQQKAVQKHVKGSQKKKGVTVTQQSTEEPPEESRDVPITVTGESEQIELVKSTTGRREESQRQEVQELISHVTEIRRVTEKTGSKSVKTLLGIDSDWQMSLERKCEMQRSVAESDAQDKSEILSHVSKAAEPTPMQLEDNETVEKHECEPVSEKSLSDSATTRISKISIGSAKIENQTRKKTSHERRKEEVSQCKSVDLRAPSPSLRMRSPSPTFITIESTRRTDSPQRVTHSPTLLHRPPTPPTPPPRRCDTPTSRLTRITPSPTFDRAENLARLKDTTAKLSRGVTPPPLLPQQISEKKSEIVESPASFHRQIKIESQLPETRMPWNISEPSSVSVREKREFFEEAHKAEINKTYVRKEPIAIPERLGPDMEECEEENKNKEKDVLPKADLSGLVNKFESPEEKLYLRKELITKREPPAFSETQSSTEHFSNVDEFGNKVTGTRTVVTEHSESVLTQPAPFSYADAVKRKAALAARRTETYDADATDTLLSNFHKTWSESETVFKSLGYTVSEETTSQVVSHQTEIVSEVGAVHGVSEESLSDGCSDSGQKKIP